MSPSLCIPDVAKKPRSQASTILRLANAIAKKAAPMSRGAVDARCGDSTKSSTASNVLIDGPPVASNFNPDIDRAIQKNTRHPKVPRVSLLNNFVSGRYSALHS